MALLSELRQLEQGRICTFIPSITPTLHAILLSHGSRLGARQRMNASPASCAARNGEPSSAVTRRAGAAARHSLPPIHGVWDGAPVLIAHFHSLYGPRAASLHGRKVGRGRAWVGVLKVGDGVRRRHTGFLLFYPFIPCIIHLPFSSYPSLSFVYTCSHGEVYCRPLGHAPPACAHCLGADGSCSLHGMGSPELRS